MSEPFLTLILPFAPRVLWPNARAHWQAKRLFTKQYRGLAARMAESRMEGPPPRLPSGRIAYTFIYPTTHFHDEDNCTGSMKAARDGFCDAGIFVNDKHVKSTVDRVVVPNAPKQVEVRFFKDE